MLKAVKAHKVLLAHREPQERRAAKVQQELRETQGLRVFRERKAPQGRKALLAHKEQSEVKERQERQATGQQHK